jgi:hypothetical protein
MMHFSIAPVAAGYLHFERAWLMLSILYRSKSHCTRQSPGPPLVPVRKVIKDFKLAVVGIRCDEV